MDTAASGLDAFGKLAPYLQHPLVLIGFVLLLVFGIHRLLIKSGIIPPVDQTTGGRIVHTLLRYGFIIALVIIVLGFAYVFLQRPSTDARTELGVLLGAFFLCALLIFVNWRLEGRTSPAETEREAEQILSILQEQLRTREHESRAKDETIRELSEALRDAVGTIAAKVEAPGRHPAADQAFARLREGDTRATEEIFRQIEEAKVAEGQAAYREAAEAARRRGALAYLRSTTEALTAYRRAAELDPDDFSTWIFISRLEKRSGDLADAERAARQALAIAEHMPDDRSQSLAQDELGDVKRAQGDLPAALAAYDASLAIRKRLADADPGNAEWQRDLIVSHVKLAEWFSEQPGDAARVRQHYRQALDVVRRLQAGARLNPADAWMVDELEQRLATAEAAAR